VITPRLVWLLGLSQLLCWGSSYYLIGVLGERIAADLGWSSTLTYSGFSVGLVVMGLVSPLVGRLIDRNGGRSVMALGSVVLALGCVGLSISHGIATYMLSWIVLGVGMRMTLYEAAFATLVFIGGASARRSISQITLLGGLASTVFWPVGLVFAEAFGWRGAALAYSGIALLTLPLHLAVPRSHGGIERTATTPVTVSPLTRTAGERRLAQALYALIVMLGSFLNTGMSAHMIGLMTGLGMAGALAVWVATFRGIGQSLARLGDVLFGTNVSPLRLGVMATGILPFCFLAGLLSGASIWAGLIFAFGYGAGNGLLTIVRGTQPLVLFDPRSYGALVGRLTAPSFVVSAIAPISYAFLIDRFGDRAALHVSAFVAALALAASLILLMRFGSRSQPE
jgi:MFS family permease